MSGQSTFSTSNHAGMAGCLPSVGFVGTVQADHAMRSRARAEAATTCQAL